MSGTRTPGGLHPPDKSAILELEAFVGVQLANVLMPRSDEQLMAAWADLRSCRYVGFDTESKPTFVSGQESSGPDVAQFATATKAYVLQLRHRPSETLVRAVLTDRGIVKVGFDLKQDQAQLRQRLGLEAAPVLDLTRVFHRKGYPRSLGIKSAVAIVFGQRFIKSKKLATTNWSNERLEPRQVLYAANDAYVALRVLEGLGLEDEEVKYVLEASR
jgi:ribonuclease D